MSQIIQGEGIKIFRVEVEGGNPIEVPIHEMLLDLIEPVKALRTIEHALIIRDAGITVPDHFITEDHEDELMQIALSIVQNAWYETVFSVISEEDRARAARIAELHASRVEKFNELVAKTKAKAAPVAKVRPIREPKAPRVQAPAGPKPVSTSRIAGRLYTINPSGDISLVANLTGFRKAIYEALKGFTSGTKATFDQVLEQAKGQGTIFKGADGGKNQTAYQLKELVAMNLVLLNTEPEQTEIPGTAEAVATGVLTDTLVQ